MENNYRDSDECWNDINYYQRQVSSQEQERNEIQKKIDRLKAVRDSIAGFKHDIQTEWYQAGAERYKCANLSDWKGKRHDTFIQYYNDVLLKDYKSYYTRIDEIHDALNTEITRLQNKIYEMNGVLGWFRARLNDCWNWLNNLTN